jgi:hypothetical protein
VYRLHRSGCNWTFGTRYEFLGGKLDGNWPLGPLTIAPDGSLYGTAWGRHYNNSPNCQKNGLHHPTDLGCGILFNLRLPATACTTALSFWTETIIWALDGSDSGLAPPVPAKAS